MFQPGTEICLKSLALLLAAGRGAVVQSREIGARLGVSPAWVTKALRPLARCGWLRARKGRIGGWQMIADPRRITIARLIHVLEPERKWRRCVAGHGACTDATACPFHEAWTAAVRRFESVMRATTLDRLRRFLPPELPARSGPGGRRRRATVPRGQPPRRQG